MTEDNLAPYKTIKQFSQENARLKNELDTYIPVSWKDFKSYCLIPKTV